MAQKVTFDVNAAEIVHTVAVSGGTMLMAGVRLSEADMAVMIAFILAGEVVTVSIKKKSDS